jgi:hypothetical protein
MSVQSPGNPLQILASRFELRSELGAGGTGVVHRAFDHQLGREVAIKTLRANSPELFYNLKEEFRAAASIVHPNLVRLHELFVHGSECFFTMELLDAIPFDRWVRPGAQRSFRDELNLGRRSSPAVCLPSWTESGTHRIAAASSPATLADSPKVEQSDAAARLASAATQLVRAVAALHDAGRIHCDLKPSNILVTANGRVVVLDFGLSSPRRGQFARRGFSGTLAYAAPEQMWGVALTPAADWYSVGVVLFQALTGELPDSDGHFEATMARAWAALELESTGHLPSQFAHLVSQLLQLDPRQRPTREAIVAVLDPPHQPSSTSRAHERHFVGRAAELEALRRAFLSARAGWLTAVDVRGDSGMGKTELVREFTLEAAYDGALVARGQCRLDESVPYQALDQVIDDLSKHLSLLGRADRRTFLPDDFSSLVRVFPVLGRLARIERPSEEIEGSVIRQRAVIALRQMLWRLCAWRPLIVWIDDANWGDPESQSLLCELLRDPAPPLLLIVSHREADAAWLRPVAAAVAQAQGQWLDLEAGPLDDGSCRELVETLLGRLSPERSSLAGRVTSEGEHVPLFIEQLCRLIAETSRPGDETEEPLTLFEVIERRVAALAADERRVAEIVALIDTPLPVGVVATAAGLSADDRLIVSRLAAAQLLRLTGARPEPKLTSYHHHVREAILARLDPQSKRRGHRLLAAAMERFEPTTVPEVLLHHWLGADEPARALAVALRAARAANEKFAFAHAAALYHTALGLMDATSENHLQVRTEFASALSAAGRAVEAGEQFRLIAAQTSSPDSLHLLRLSAENLLVGGQLEQGMAVLAEALTQVRLPLPSSTASAVLHSVRRVVMFRLSARARHRQPAGELDASEALRADLCSSAAKGLGAVDPMLAAYFTFWALPVAARAGDPARTATALCLSGLMLIAIGGRLRRWGQEWLDDAGRIADASGDLLLRGRVHVCRAQGEVHRGRWELVLEHCEEAWRWLDLQPDAATWERNLVHMAALRAFEEIGELRQCWKRAAEWRTAAQARGDLYAQTTANLYLAFAKLADGDPDAAERLATSALAPWSAAPPPFHEFYRLRVNGYAELYRGRPNSALGVLARAEQVLRGARLDRTPMAILEMSLLRARTALQLARTGHDAPKALLSCEREVARLDALGRSDASGYAALSQAGVEALRGNAERARRQLGVARERFEERQMSLGLLYVTAAESRLKGMSPDIGQPLSHDVNLHWLGIAEPQAWLAVHAPGFDRALRAAPSWHHPARA